MLEVADNLERAFEVAGEDAKRVQDLDADRARTLLSNLLNGLGLTDKILLQASWTILTALQTCMQMPKLIVPDFPHID